jgi:hypothetical protein
MSEQIIIHFFPVPEYAHLADWKGVKDRTYSKAKTESWAKQKAFRSTRRGTSIANPTRSTLTPPPRRRVPEVAVVPAAVLDRSNGALHAGSLINQVNSKPIN